MVMIYHDINHRKYRIFVNFRYSCSNFGGQFKGQSSRHIFSSCVWLKRRALLNFSGSLKPNSQAIFRSDVLINKVILLFCLKYYGCVPLSQHAARLIWTALSVPKGYCLDIATIALCFSFNTNAKIALNLG